MTEPADTGAPVDLDAPIDPAGPYVPPPWIAWLRRHIWKFAIGLGFTYITCSHFMLSKHPAPPPVLSVLPAFELVDHDGNPFGSAQLEGKVWVVGFVFTRCPSVCPAISRSMLHFQETFVDGLKLEEHIGMLTVSVDPEHDTPDVLRTYAIELGADLEHWRFLTGTPEAIREFVVGGFHLAVGERAEKEPGVFDIAHSTKLALVDRFGNVRGYYATDPDGLNELYHRALATMRATPDDP